MLPEGFGNLTSLIHLDQQQCWMLISLLDNFIQMKSLLFIVFDYCSGLTRVPEGTDSLKMVERHSIRSCFILKMLTSAFQELTCLR